MNLRSMSIRSHQGATQSCFQLWNSDLVNKPRTEGAANSTRTVGIAHKETYVASYCYVMSRCSGKDIRHYSAGSDHGRSSGALAGSRTTHGIACGRVHKHRDTGRGAGVSRVTRSQANRSGVERPTGLYRYADASGGGTESQTVDITKIETENTG